MPRKATHTCVGCGRSSGTGKQPEPGAEYCCRSCRATGIALRHGGDKRYKAGCRCTICVEGARTRGRQYRAERRAAGRPINQTRRKTAKTCERCSSVFLARTDEVKRGGGRFCSRACACPPVSNRPPKFKIAKTARLAIYERDGWTCQLCSEPVDPELPPTHNWSATLDHIIPRSHLLVPDDSPRNLRLAHRWCNTIRGDLRLRTDEWFAA